MIKKERGIGKITCLKNESTLYYKANEREKKGREAAAAPIGGKEKEELPSLGE